MLSTVSYFNPLADKGTLSGCQKIARRQTVTAVAIAAIQTIVVVSLASYVGLAAVVSLSVAGICALATFRALIARAVSQLPPDPKKDNELPASLPMTSRVGVILKQPPDIICEVMSSLFSSLPALPKDVIKLIIEKLDIEDLGRMGRVSKKMRELVKKLGETLLKNSQHRHSEMLLIIAKGNHLGAWTFTEAEFKDLFIQFNFIMHWYHKYITLPMDERITGRMLKEYFAKIEGKGRLAQSIQIVVNSNDVADDEKIWVVHVLPKYFPMSVYL
jgi:hypothetical protein